MHAPDILVLAALASTVMGVTGASTSAELVIRSPTFLVLSYGTGFDDGSRSLRSIACSDGDNGLIARYRSQNQPQIPHFPYIGGVQAVAGLNSKSCGACWKLTYDNRSVTVLAVDHVDTGFNIGPYALNYLTGGCGVEVGRIEAQASQVDTAQCGV